MAVPEPHSHHPPLQGSEHSGPWLSNEQAARILLYTHFSYPIVLLAVFLVAFVLHSILTAPRDTAVAGSQIKRGPGGKPLPQNTASSDQDHKNKQTLDFSVGQKLCYNWLSVALIVTFLADAIAIVAHALKEKPWWCGQSVAVGSDPFSTQVAFPNFN